MRDTFADRMISFSLDRPRIITWALILSTLLFTTLATLPSIWPQNFTALHGLKVDTDPENMLSEHEPVRIFHDQAKHEFSLNDIVVVGIVNEKHPAGVFNPESLKHIYDLTEFARKLNWPDAEYPEQQQGVIEVDIIAPSLVDNIEQGGPGVVNFSWLMPKPPATDEEALVIRDRASRIPFLYDTLVSNDGKAIALYLPLTSKSVSYNVREALLEQVEDWKGSGDEVYITGLPVAEDTFGVEMFIQMAISAPLAMLVIFLLLWWFFQKFVLIISPMIVAMVCSISTMALLVISGNTIHIMSSMIPIFVMPIAVLDAVHMLSEFFDRYPHFCNRRKTIEQVMKHLFKPMLYTTLTTIAGFASLALTPIPPVQVFGVFIAIGVFLAWLWTILFIPAFIMFIPEEKLQGFGHKSNEEENANLMSRSLHRVGLWTHDHAGRVMAGTLVTMLVAAWGISLIQINDNPIKWFTKSHPIRVADRVLNEHFGGTYMAYLQFEPTADASSVTDYVPALIQRMEIRKTQSISDELPSAEAIFDQVLALIDSAAKTMETRETLLASLASQAEIQLEAASDTDYDTWDEVLLFLDEERQRTEIFKQPEALNYLDHLQQHLLDTGIVGKSNSVVDVVKTVHRELLLGEDKEFRIPDSARAIAQTLITYQNSHRPHHLWHFITPDYRKAVLWLQLTSGDNRDMDIVKQAVADFTAGNPPPMGLKPNWFGLTYINTVWQDKMVSGMLKAFMGSFVVVLLMMVFLFRSLWWGLLSMIPLTVTVGLIYGIIGLIGKNYDMPVAVLSSLSLGLAVDYAIHFLVRSREARKRHDSWRKCISEIFGEPARAITRNAIILGAGFLPLLAAPLVPYKTVGIFIATIIVSAGAATLLILTALIRILEKWLFKPDIGSSSG